MATKLIIQSVQPKLNARLDVSHGRFVAVEKLRVCESVLFCFLVGNEDMHLKNFSIVVIDDRVAVAPAYDLLNTTISLAEPREELAWPLRGKKNRLQRADLIDYFFATDPSVPLVGGMQFYVVPILKAFPLG